MPVRSVSELGAFARDVRLARGLTQADVAARAAIGRDVVGRFERGHPRLELRAALDILAALGLQLAVEERADAAGRAAADEGDMYGDAYEESY